MFNHGHIYSNPGKPYKIVYGSRIDKHGNVIVEEKGKEDLYSLIQSYADSTDINLIVKKFEAGDVNALNKRAGQFMDLTELPNDYFEMVNKVNDAKYEFNRLPVEIKAKFDNDPNKFIAEIGSEDWYTKLFLEKKQEEKIEEVKKEETVSE